MTTEQQDVLTTPSVSLYVYVRDVAGKKDALSCVYKSVFLSVQPVFLPAAESAKYMCSRLSYRSLALARCTITCIKQGAVT